MSKRRILRFKKQGGAVKAKYTYKIPFLWLWASSLYSMPQCLHLLNGRSDCNYGLKTLGLEVIVRSLKVIVRSLKSYCKIFERWVGVAYYFILDLSTVIHWAPHYFSCFLGTCELATPSAYDNFPQSSHGWFPHQLQVCDEMSLSQWDLTQNVCITPLQLSSLPEMNLLYCLHLIILLHC